MSQNRLNQAHLAELEQITDRFKTRWRSGSRPLVKEFADTASLPARRSLLLKLISVDVDYRRRAGETPSIDDYKNEFPELNQADLELLTTIPLTERSTVLTSESDITPDLPDAPTNISTSNRFVKLEEIGRGGMGLVWRAIQVSTEREVALKELPAKALSSQKARSQFEDEIHWASQLQHPHIARVYDSGLMEGLYFYAMELIQGEHLDKYAKRNRWTLRQMLGAMKAIAEAIQYAHERRIIHRDLKPSNILVTQGGQPIIVDFGLARLVHDSTIGKRPKHGEICGTPAFMAPEQFLGREDLIDRQTDIFSLGIIMYYFATGVFPQSLKLTPDEKSKELAAEEIRPPSELNNRAGKDLDAMIMKCLAFNPADRYAEAHQLASDIDRLLKGQELQARPLNWIGRVKSWCCRPTRLLQVSNFSISIGAILAPFHIMGICLAIAQFCGILIPGFNNLRLSEFIALMTGFLFFDAWLFFTGFMVRRNRIWPLWVNLVIGIGWLTWFIVVLLGIVKFDTGGTVNSMAVRLPVYLIFMGLTVVGLVSMCLAINAHRAQAYLDESLLKK